MVCPDDVHVLIPKSCGFIRDLSEKIALHVYGIHSPSALKSCRDSMRVRATPCTKVGDAHPRLNAKRNHIPARMCKTSRLSRRSVMCSLLHRSHYTSQNERDSTRLGKIRYVSRRGRGGIRTKNLTMPPLQHLPRRRQTMRPGRLRAFSLRARLASLARVLVSRRDPCEWKCAKA